MLATHTTSLEKPKGRSDATKHVMSENYFFCFQQTQSMEEVGMCWVEVLVRAALLLMFLQHSP